MPRITQQSLTNNTLNALRLNLEKLERFQAQLSSGKAVSKPSDAPGQTMSALRLRAEMRRSDQYVRNAQDGVAYLGIADNTLTGVLTSMGRVRELLVYAANTGSIDSSARAGIKNELVQLKEQLLGAANTKYLDRAIFAGTNGAQQAYVNPAPAYPPGMYAGNDGVIERTVARGADVPINVTGPQVFGTESVTGPAASGVPFPGSTQLFEVLDNVIWALDNKPAQLTTEFASFETAQSRVEDSLGLVGSRYNRLQTMLEKANAASDIARRNLSETEDVDVPKTIMEVRMQETSYQAALSATARVIMPSLVDFLR